LSNDEVNSRKPSSQCSSLFEPFQEMGNPGAENVGNGKILQGERFAGLFVVRFSTADNLAPYLEGYGQQGLGVVLGYVQPGKT